MPDVKFWKALPWIIVYHVAMIGVIAFVVFGVWGAAVQLAINKKYDVQVGMIIGAFITWCFFMYMAKVETKREEKRSLEIKDTCRKCFEAYEMYKTCDASGMQEDAVFYLERYEEHRAKVIGMLGDIQRASGGGEVKK